METFRQTLKKLQYSTLYIFEKNISNWLTLDIYIKKYYNFTVKSWYLDQTTLSEIVSEKERMCTRGTIEFFSKSHASWDFGYSHTRIFYFFFIQKREYIFFYTKTRIFFSSRVESRLHFFLSPIHHSSIVTRNKNILFPS